MLGLQTARKTDSIESMIANFAFLLDKQGFIPNGNRTYYLSRSQPPFFALMVQLLADSKGEQILVKYLPQLEKEYNFWMAGKPKAKGTAQKRVVLLADGSLLNRYWDDRNAPRAESYAEDMHTAKQVPENKNIYHDLRAGAESGWDFSSRWFRDVNSLATIHTTEIIPVDLNALLYNLERTIAQAYQIQKNAPSTQKYLEKAEARKKALLQYCWNEKNGFFQDYDFVLQKHTPVLSLAGVYPLCFQIATSVQSKQVAAVLKAQFLKAGGLISTPNHTKQQWDAPNGWAPLQWMAIWGLRNYQQTDLADEIRLRWVSLNEKVFKKTGKLLEKYNVEDLSLIAGGGEYPLQDGFGWTNGVLLKLLSNK
jgi:alpha,alpha-trehalase